MTPKADDVNCTVLRFTRFDATQEDQIALEEV